MKTKENGTPEPAAPVLARDSLTGSGGLVEAVAAGTAGGVGSAVVTQVTSHFLHRPEPDTPHVEIPPGTVKPG